MSTTIDCIAGATPDLSYKWRGVERLLEIKRPSLPVHGRSRELTAALIIAEMVSIAREVRAQIANERVADRSAELSRDAHVCTLADTVRFTSVHRIFRTGETTELAVEAAVEALIAGYRSLLEPISVFKSRHRCEDLVGRVFGLSRSERRHLLAFLLSFADRLGTVLRGHRDRLDAVECRTRVHLRTALCGRGALNAPPRVVSARGAQMMAGVWMQPPMALAA